jgi:hypothetical protein
LPHDPHPFLAVLLEHYQHQGLSKERAEELPGMLALPLQECFYVCHALTQPAFDPHFVQFDRVTGTREDIESLKQVFLPGC